MIDSEAKTRVPEHSENKKRNPELQANHKNTRNQLSQQSKERHVCGLGWENLKKLEIFDETEFLDKVEIVESARNTSLLSIRLRLKSLNTWSIREIEIATAAGGK